MARFDIQSVIVLGAALLASLSAATAVRHFTGERGTAMASPSAMVATYDGAARGSAAQILKSQDGHYWAEATIDGRAVRVLVDTGASLVALTREDAVRLGVNPKPSEFTGSVLTASGTVRAAPLELAAVSVGGARIEKVQAMVVEEGLAHSLLGMSYLGRLSAFEATPTGLTLRP